MGDRLAVFQHGQLEQVGTPEQVFQASATRFVAEFMGNSRFLSGTATQDGIHTEAGELQQPANAPVGAAVEVAVRADDVGFQPDANGNGVILKRAFRGLINVYRLRLDSGQEVEALKEHTEVYPTGARVNVFIDAGHPLCIFPGSRE